MTIKDSNDLLSKLELYLYLKENAFSRSVSFFNILRWWKTNEIKYSILQKHCQGYTGHPNMLLAHEIECFMRIFWRQ